MKTIPLKLLFLCHLIIQSVWIERAGAEQPLATVPKHLTNARWLVAHLDLNHTDYEHGNGTVSFTNPCVSKTDCSGLVNALLKFSYNYDAEKISKIFGSERPTARRYHDAIQEQKYFKLIEHVQDAQPGDFMAVKYLIQKDNTGHVMLVAGSPAKITPKALLVADTMQWEVPVIDSSKSGHGPTDTRHKKGADGKDHEGLGEGIFRIYTDSQGKIAGFAWSTIPSSKFEEPKEEDLVIGRLLSESEKPEK